MNTSPTVSLVSKWLIQPNLLDAENAPVRILKTEIRCCAKIYTYCSWAEYSMASHLCESAPFCVIRQVPSQYQRRGARTASSPAAREEIDRESRRPGLRARASADRLAGKWPGAGLPKRSPTHPSRHIRARFFLGFPAPAEWKEEPAGEQMLNQSGSLAPPGTG